MSAAVRVTNPAPQMPPEFANEEQSVHITGFWMFLVTDVLIFASLFASYAVYRPMVATGPSAAMVLRLGPAIAETFILLTSSFTIGLAVFAMRRSQAQSAKRWLMLTVVLGLAFVGLEAHDFVAMAAQGAEWSVSAFLSAFFLLVSTHGAHVSFGIFWALGLLLQLQRRGLTAITTRKLFTFSLYWHFLDLVWVFIFTAVYLGARIP
jgi:heme/copper-type cytochrome/quinol oxidase subunit 3